METNENILEETPVVNDTPTVENNGSSIEGPSVGTGDDPMIEEEGSWDDEPTTEEVDVLSVLIKLALNGYEMPDILANYAPFVGWDAETVNSAILSYEHDFGQFLMDEGLIDSEVEKKFLNYTMHYQIMDSLIRLGKIDFCKTVDEFNDWLVTWANTKNYQSVLDALSMVGGKEIVTANSVEELSTVDATKALLAEGITFLGDSKVKTVTADSIVLKNASIASKGKKTTITLKANGDVTVDGLTVEGDFPAHSLPQLIIKSDNKDEVPGCVSITNAKMAGQAGMNNTIYVGDILEGTNFKEITIEGCDFSEAKGNCALSFYGWADDAVINIKNCHFGHFSNPLTFLNSTNKTCTVNIENCVFDRWELTYPDFSGVNEEYGYDYAYTYAGMILLEDHLSGSSEAEMANKKFAKMTINMTNCTGPFGKIVAPKKLSDICGCMSEKQVIYICYTNTKPYTDANGKKVSNIGYAGYEDHFPKINIG